MLVQRLSGVVLGAFVGYIVLGVLGLVLMRAHLATAATLFRSGEVIRGPVMLALLGVL